MKKIAVFVEGQTELIVVREFLLRKFTWEVNLLCLELYSQTLRKVPYEYESPQAKFFYQIVNIGNDKRVLSAILEREKSLWDAGFVKLIGLRDMYSQEYRERVKPNRIINAELNEQFIAEALKVVDGAKSPDKIHVCFSVMEIESWFLGMHKFLERTNPNYNPENISNAIGHKLEDIDPEITFFHASDVLDQVFSIDGNRYKKHESDVEAILKQLQAEDFQELYDSPKCNSFNKFHDEVLTT